MDEKQFASHMLKILQENIQGFSSSKPVISIKKPLSVAEFEKLNLNYKNLKAECKKLSINVSKRTYKKQPYIFFQYFNPQYMSEKNKIIL